MEQAPSRPNYPVFRHSIIAAVTLLTIFITGFAIWKAIAEYRLTIRAAELQTSGYARALKEHAERAFSEADNILLDVLGHIKSHNAVEDETSEDLRAYLARIPRETPQIGAIIVVNQEGFLFAHSLPTTVKQAKVADREYFIHHSNTPGDNSPFISKPIISRVNGKWRFTLSRPLRDRNGSFAGLVAVAFEMDYFQSFYASLDLGKKGRIVVLRKDAVPLLTQPFRESDMSVDFRNSHLFKTYLPQSPKGTFRIEPGKALLESAGRIISYESLDHFPIVVNANVGLDEVTEQWQRTTLIQALLTLLAFIAVWILALTLLRQIRRSEDAYSLLEKHQAEIALAEERYRTLVEHLPVVTWKADNLWNPIFMTAVVTEIDGYTPEEIYAGGRELMLSRIHPDDMQRVTDSYSALFQEGEFFDVEFRIRHKAGHWIWIHNFAYATAPEDGRLVAYGVFSNITLRKNTEEERDQLEMLLRQAQKMEAIGHLAGGIAHDFNNLLTPILGYAEMISARLNPGDPLISKVAGISAAGHKAKDLTQQLLSFGRRQPISTSVVDLNEVIESFYQVLRRTIRESIHINLTLDPSGAFIAADRSQMEQIVLNMTVNAQDALSGKGDIVIETCNVLMEGENVRLHPGMTEGNYTLLSFHDTGCGMSSEVLAHIFEPFFTTKPVGHGTGLGLATVYGIVKQHNGHISVTSRENEGTTFRIYLPATSILPLMETKETAAESAHDTTERNILVVEDNDMVREMVKEMLEGYGYHVLVAADAQQAIEVASSSRIDLLVSDVVMPGMSGPELYEQMIVKMPTLRVVFISGYPMNPSIRNGTLEEEVNYLQKPFTAEALLERIRMVSQL